MTTPTMPPGTPQGPWHPRVDAHLKPCGCGVWIGEECDCAEFAAEAAAAFASPIAFRFTAGAYEGVRP